MRDYRFNCSSGAVYERDSYNNYIFIGKLRDKTLSQFILDHNLSCIDNINTKKDLKMDAQDNITVNHYTITSTNIHKNLKVYRDVFTISYKEEK